MKSFRKKTKCKEHYLDNQGRCHNCGILLEKHTWNNYIGGDGEITMNNGSTLTPAYGRDYKKQTDALKDFEDNKDFVISDISSKWDGAYVNKAQCIEAGVTRVGIRYNKLTKIFFVEVKNG